MDGAIGTADSPPHESTPVTTATARPAPPGSR